MTTESPRISWYPRGRLGVCWRKACAFGVVAAALLGACLAAPAQDLPAGPAEALQAKRLELQPQLRSNAFREPLHLSSREGTDQVQGDVHAELAHPFADVAAMFKSPGAVCELLFLHLNVHSCRPSTIAGADVLSLTAGPKRAQASGMMYRLDYTMRVEVATPAYMRVTLTAPKGPLSTRDYRIVFEAVPIEGGRSFVHLGYSYSYGTLARMAMSAYLATAGRSKIGFTVVGKDDDGKPVYVRGERGALERNVIRYFLAVLAHRSVNTGSPQAQMEARLRSWFALTERYAAQLHELDLDEYLQEKHEDLAAGKAP